MAAARAKNGFFAEVSQAVALVIADTAGGFDYRSMADELVRTNPIKVISELVTESATVPSVDVDTASPALLLVSGGTTGAPKLIPRTHDDYVYNVTASAELCGLTADDVYLVALPAAHNFPLACPGLLGAISAGATTVFTADPSPESIETLLAERKPGYVTYQGWQAIDTAEKAAGEPQGRPRVKLCTFDELLEAAASAPSVAG